MENHIKDEQIQRQAEEIESQARKIASLEAELQKCLDPDSGELNPSIRYHYRTGESALVERIQSLEKQLTDCLEDSPETIRFRSDVTPSRVLEAFITNIGASLFLPLEYYDEKLGKVKDSRYGVWSTLVFILIERPEFLDLWGNTHFRRAVNMVNEATAHLDHARLKEDEAMGEYEIAAEYLCIGNAEDHEAIKTLRIVLERLYKIEWDQSVGLEKVDIDYLIFALQIIIQCQRLYLTMQMNSKE